MTYRNLIFFGQGVGDTNLIGSQKRNLFIYQNFRKLYTLREMYESEI